MDQMLHSWELKKQWHDTFITISYGQSITKHYFTSYSNDFINIILIINGQNLRVSELLLLNANSAIFQLHHGENKLSFNEMMMMSALY